MRVKKLYPWIGFAVIFLLHLIFSLRRLSKIEPCMQIEETSLMILYLKEQIFFLSYAYALLGAFTVYALIKCFQNCKTGILGIAGGITLTGFIYLAGCVLLGCCGSPLLFAYLGLFGSSVLKFAKPIIAVITTIFVIMGYFWIRKRSKPCYFENKKEIPNANNSK